MNTIQRILDEDRINWRDEALRLRTQLRDIAAAVGKLPASECAVNCSSRVHLLTNPPQLQLCNCGAKAIAALKELCHEPT